MTARDPHRAPEPALDERLAGTARALREQAPPGLHARIMRRVPAAPPRAAPAPLRPRAPWLGLAAAALLLALGWGSAQWLATLRAPAAAAPLHALHEVTAAPSQTVRRLTEAPVVRAVGSELRAELRAELDSFEARTGSVARELARNLSGPLRLLARLP